MGNKSKNQGLNSSFQASTGNYFALRPLIFVILTYGSEESSFACINILGDPEGLKW